MRASSYLTKMTNKHLKPDKYRVSTGEVLLTPYREATPEVSRGPEVAENCRAHDGAWRVFQVLFNVLFFRRNEGTNLEISSQGRFRRFPDANEANRT